MRLYASSIVVVYTLLDPTGKVLLGPQEMPRIENFEPKTVEECERFLAEAQKRSMKILGDTKKDPGETKCIVKEY